MERFLLPVALAALIASPAKPAAVVAKASPPVILADGREVIEFRGCRRIEKGEQCELVFAQKDADTRQMRLVFEARFDWSSLGGYAPGLHLSINGQPLVGARLLNKPLEYKTRNGGGNRWAAPDGASYFVMYSGDFSDEIQTNTDYMYGLYEQEQEPYRFVLDLTGLTQHVGDNRVVLRALCFLWSGDWSEHIFPFTPLEVRPGYLICQERIVTRLSGRFGWNDASVAEVFVYDGEGKRTSSSEVTVVPEAGASVFEVRIPSDHVAIIVRK